ncbi:MAG: response regulator [Deltaproteobacteria bacterium]|nr:response regulator [Deltaproteobacteria bacterium]
MSGRRAEILLIEDDARLAAMLVTYLGENGFHVTTSGDAAGGLGLARRSRFGAVIRDVMLPDLDGFEVCRRLRAESDVPIVMLTARGDATDRIVGLELGADDYLPKPFEPRELLARLRAVLRRRRPAPSGGSADGGVQGEILRFGRLEIDLGARTARLDGAACELTSHQFELLRILATEPGRVLSRDVLMDRLRGEALAPFDRSIDVHVSRIRAAIEDDPKHPKRILTVRGFGYVFARTQD